MTIEISKEQINFGQVKRDKSKTDTFDLTLVAGINYIITAPEGYWLIDPVTSGLVKKIDLATNYDYLVTHADEFFNTNDDQKLTIVL